MLLLAEEMEQFMALLRLLGRRRRGRRYRADDDYQEGYEDVYYYTSKYNTHLMSESHRQTLREREALFYSVAGQATEELINRLLHVCVWVFVCVCGLAL